MSNRQTINRLTPVSAALVSSSDAPLNLVFFYFRPGHQTGRKEQQRLRIHMNCMGAATFHAKSHVFSRTSRFIATSTCDGQTEGHTIPQNTALAQRRAVKNMFDVNLHLMTLCIRVTGCNQATRQRIITKQVLIDKLEWRFLQIYILITRICLHL